MESTSSVARPRTSRPTFVLLVGMVGLAAAWSATLLQPQTPTLPLLGPGMGVAVVLALRCGPSTWPVAAACGGALALILGLGSAAAAGVASAYGVGLAIAARTLRHVPIHGACPGLNGTQRFLITLSASLTLAPALGALTLASAGVIPWSDLATRALGWWAGDVLGACLVVCAALSVDGQTRERLRKPAARTRAVAAWLAVAGLSAAAFLGAGSQPIAYALLLLLVGVAAHEGRFVSAVGALIVTVAALGSAAAGIGAFAGAPFLHVWSFAIAATLLQALVAATSGDHVAESEALEESELRNRDLMEAAADGVFLISAAGVVTDANHNACQSLGLTPEELIGMRVADFDANMTDADVREGNQRVIAGGTVPFETVHRRADGTTFPVEIQSSPLHLAGELGVIAVARDLTERRHAERALVENEERLRAIVDNEPECVKVLDAECTLLDMNPAGLCMIAAEDIEQVRGLNTLELVAPEFRESFAEGVARVFAGEKTFQVFEIIALDGSHHWMEQHAVPLWTSEDPPRVKEMLAVTREITERKLAEEQMLHRQRLEALGTLSGGIAHDLNNMLAPIMLALDELGEAAGVSEGLVATLDGSVHRASDMVRQLLSFARGLDGEHEPLAPQSLLDELERILRATFPKNIALTIGPAAATGSIHGDATQLHQVLLNLCVNARDAMPAGGVLTVTTSMVQVEGEDGEHAPGRYLMFEIRDTGVGIPATAQRQIFEPFYTTKGPDKGTGLGLSSAMGILAGHGGFVTVESEVGQGSTFRVHLPLHESTCELPRPPAPPPPVAGGKRKVLVVDDEDAVRKVTERSLERLGFDVLSARDGQEGREQLTDHLDEIELVVSDLRMPGMRGTEFLREARRLSPGVAMILTTGHLDAQASEEMRDLSGLVRLEKPYGLSELKAALQQAL